MHGRRHQGVVRRRSSQRGAPRRRRQGGDGRRARELKLADAASAAREHVTWFWMSVQGEPVDAQTGAVVVYGDASTKLGTSRYPPDALEGAPTRSPRPRPCPRSRSSRASARRSSCRRRATTPRTRTPGAASSLARRVRRRGPPRRPPQPPRRPPRTASAAVAGSPPAPTTGATVGAVRAAVLRPGVPLAAVAASRTRPEAAARSAAGWSRPSRPRPPQGHQAQDPRRQRHLREPARPVLLADQLISRDQVLPLAVRPPPLIGHTAE